MPVASRPDAVDAQRSLAAYRGPQEVRVRVRTGLHTAESHFGATGYVGIDVHRAARIPDELLKNYGVSLIGSFRRPYTRHPGCPDC